MFNINYKIKFLLACIILTTFMFFESILNLNLVKGDFISNIYHSILGLILAVISILFIQKNKLFKEKIKSFGLSKIFSILVSVCILTIILNANLNPKTSAIITFDLSIILQSFILAFTTALFEETLMRGLFFESLLEYFKKDTYFYSAIFSSLIFGLAHFFNLKTEHPIAVLQQVIFASIIGIMLSFIRIKFNGLIFPIIIHFLIDFQKKIVDTQSLNNSNWLQIIITFIPMLTISIIAIYLLNKDIKKSLQN